MRREDAAHTYWLFTTSCGWRTRWITLASSYLVSRYSRLLAPPGHASAALINLISFIAVISLASQYRRIAPRTAVATPLSTSFAAPRSHGGLFSRCE